MNAITRNPDILSGKPILSGTRISVEFILEMLASGMTQDAIAHEYHLDPGAVSAAVAYAAAELKREDVIDHGELERA